MHRERKMVFSIICCTFLILVIMSSVPVMAGDDPVILWGKQKAGTGPGSNATQDGNTVEVKKSAEILKIEGTAKDYCIWKVGGYRGLLCGGEKRKSIIGETLPKGKYIVRAGLSKGQSTAEVRITLDLK